MQVFLHSLCMSKAIYLNLVGEKIRCEQIGSVPTFLSVRANKFA